MVVMELLFFCIGWLTKRIVVGDVNLFTIFRAFDENTKAKLKCVKYVLHELSYLRVHVHIDSFSLQKLII